MKKRLDKDQVAELLYSALRFHIPKRWKLGDEDAQIAARSIAMSIPFQSVEVYLHEIGSFNDLKIDRQ